MLLNKRLAKLALLSEFSLIGTLLFLNWQFTSLLIKTAMHIHCDGTYKWIWQGHTLIVGGTTDKAKQWHQLGVCISKNEKSRDWVFFSSKAWKKLCLMLRAKNITPHAWFLMQQGRLAEVLKKLLATKQSMNIPVSYAGNM